MAVAALLALGLGGCVAVWGDGHKVTHRDDNSIAIDFDPAFSSDDHIESIANGHCSQRGATAVLEKESRKSIMGGIHVHRFRCERTAAAEKPAIELLRESVDRFGAKDWTRAADLASEAIAKGSLSVNQAAAAYALRGYCRFATGRLNEALSDVTRAVQLRPDFTAAIEFREALLRARGQPRSPRQHGPLAPDEDLRPPIIEF